MIGLSVPHGCDIRVSIDTTQWPPSLIFGFSYGSAALAAWGINEFKQFARERTAEYYPTFWLTMGMTIVTIVAIAATGIVMMATGMSMVATGTHLIIMRIRPVGVKMVLEGN